MGVIGDAWSWLTTGSHWSGEAGVWHRLAEHLYLTFVSLGVACAIALPVGVGLGHLGRGGTLAINLSNVGRAVPTFAVLVLLLLSPLGSHGDLPVILALVLFAVPPLLTNAYVGMREVDREVVQAARGMGMTGGQLVARVELPLAFPLLMTGVRTAAVQVVATATLAALPGGGGLGRIITAGFRLTDTAQVVAGAVLVAVLALLVEGALVVLERLADPLRRRGGRARAAASTAPADQTSKAPAALELTAAGAVTAVALVAVLVAGSGESLEKSGGGGSGKLVVGSAPFAESRILAELYAQLLDDAGYSTSIKTVDTRELYEPALEKGQIDVVPEYAATLTEFLNQKTNGPDAKPVATPDVETTVRELEKLAGPRGLKALPAGEAVDQNAFAVTEEFAAEHHLKTLSDLGKSKQKITLAAGDECAERPFCQPGLEKTYGIDIAGIDPLDAGSVQAKQAVKDGKDQMVLTVTTDATLDQFGLVLLEDDKHLQNADNVLPVVNEKTAGAKKIEETLNKINKVLTTADLTELNKKVDAERLKPADVAADYLEEKGLLRK